MPPTLPAGYSLKPSKESELDDLVALELRCYPAQSAYSRQEYRYVLTRAHALNLTLRDPARAVVGFAGAFLHAGWRAGHVYTVNVDPSQRGKGLGRVLMEALEAGMRREGMARSLLEVNVANATAIGLYEAMGYERLKRLKDYYTTYPEKDAFLYGKNL